MLRSGSLLRHGLCALFLLLQGWCAAAQAQTESAARESTVKAAFLFKFGSFVEWPATAFARPGDPLVIGVAGDDAVADDLEQLVAGRNVDSRPVQVRRIRDAQSAAATHILFLGAVRDSRLRSFMPAPTAPVLVVTDQEGALDAGSVINFSLEQGRLRFSAAPPAAEARGLRLSARLLAVAQNLQGRSR